jgi:hypothetical protein
LEGFFGGCGFHGTFVSYCCGWYWGCWGWYWFSVDIVFPFGRADWLMGMTLRHPHQPVNT